MFCSWFTFLSFHSLKCLTQAFDTFCFTITSVWKVTYKAKSCKVVWKWIKVIKYRNWLENIQFITFLLRNKQQENDWLEFTCNWNTSQPFSHFDPASLCVGGVSWLHSNSGIVRPQFCSPALNPSSSDHFNSWETGSLPPPLKTWSNVASGDFTSFSSAFQQSAFSALSSRDLFLQSFE